uniref:Uncharacterized protein n=1 Tax=Strigamia maritima TaxID=126957 RepID=T1JK70_STRMM
MRTILFQSMGNMLQVLNFTCGNDVFFYFDCILKEFECASRNKYKSFLPFNLCAKPIPYESGHFGQSGFHRWTNQSFAFQRGDFLRSESNPSSKSTRELELSFLFSNLQFFEPPTNSLSFQHVCCEVGRYL